jgi:lanosterol synthase
VLIGDAAGHYHPMTASGMTLGFGDALTLAETGDFKDFMRKRFRAIRTPELLAIELYEVFVDHRFECAAVRRAVYRRWRASSSFRDQTIRLLACEETSPARLNLTGGAILARAITREIPRSCDQAAWRRTRETVRALSVRVRWLWRGVRLLRKARRKGREDERILDSLSHALPASMPPGPGDTRPMRTGDGASSDAESAFNRARARLVRLQGENGAWEGEMVWCPMLTAQYVLLHHLLGRQLKPGRRRRVLKSFERTRLEGGAWGLHEHAAPHLFVSTLVYVAARLLGVERDDPLVEPARRFLREEGVSGIPSWGKFWLALLNLHDWRGVNPILPELWSLPRRVPLHPANWYCHTRLIYMAMAAVYARRFQVPVTPVIASLREELYVEPFADIDFSRSRNRLRDEDLYARPSPWLRAGYGFARVFERFHVKRLRARCVETILRRIRWELRTTDHASISPVSGLINILALWLHDPADTDCRRALRQLDGWIWEDEEGGARITGARSTSWDTGFSLQALATVPDSDGVRDALRHGASYLRRQQIGVSFEGFREAYRADPKGGWCFPGAAHGWPVTDCTAEAVLGITDAHPDAADATMLRDAAGFMLRGQNRDGGFGSYEARRSRIGLEWLNPAEMFGDSMTERSYVECTASCLAALSACRQRLAPSTGVAIATAISRAEAWLRRSQTSDGSWRGVWGIQFIYGTMFGVRGLVAAGARPGDPALRLACRWLLDRQRPDGGWGEHHSGCVIGQYVPHEQSQVIQTAWALIALLTADDSNWSAISRGVRFLIDTQDADGAWPRQQASGVFFRTALLEYALYRDYFPLYALGLYEQRRRNRLSLATPAHLRADATD